MSESTLKPEILKQFVNPVFIETGTGKGEGIACALECGFDQIISIEANPRVFEMACRRFRNEDNVLCVLGDSGQFLEKVLRGINQPVTFWIDAHWSTGEPDLPLGSSNCPILADITQIGKHHIKNHVIMVDDIRYFRQGIPQWGNVKLGDIMQSIMDINSDYRISFVDGHVENDILIAQVPAAKETTEDD